MKKILFHILIISFLGTSAYSLDCDRINEAENNYADIARDRANFSQIIRVQQIIGAVVDGQWGSRSESAYGRYLSQCLSHSTSNGYTADLGQNVSGGTIIDHFKIQTIFEEIPVTKCVIEEVPIFQNQSGGNDDLGSFVSGALIGGIMGKAITKEDGGAAVGAVIGGVLANESQKSTASNRIVGYEEKKGCTRKVKTVGTQEEQYSHSTITFQLDGQTYTSKFIRY